MSIPFNELDAFRENASSLSMALNDGRISRNGSAVHSCHPETTRVNIGGSREPV